MMNGFNLFNKQKEETVSKYKYSYYINVEDNSDVEEINDCNLYVSYKEELTGDYILREKLLAPEISTAKKEIIYVNAKNNDSAQDILGFSIAPDFTPEVRRNATRVARLTYFNMLDMVDTYANLAKMARQKDVEVINNLNQQMKIMSAIMLKIYQQISNGSRIPTRTNKVNVLPKNYCAAIDITSERLDKVAKDLFRLRRLVDIKNINRQLYLMQNIVENQFTTLNNLRKNCIN